MEEQYVKSRFQISIPEFNENYIDGDTITFYKILVFDNLLRKKWIINKRYSEIDSLHKILSKIYPNIPPMPGKTFFKVKEKEALEKRKGKLETFLKECANREDIVKNETFTSFLEIAKHSSDIEQNAPTVKFQNDEIPLGVRDCYYYEKENILFITCSDMNIGKRIDSYLLNVNLPWEKKTGKHVTVGAAFAFRVREERKGSAIFKKLWGKSYPEQTGAISFDEKTYLVQVGLDSGTIYFYQTYSEKKFADYLEVKNFRPHTARVMGLSYDPKEGNIYSCGSDKKFVVANINDLKNPIEVGKSNSGYTSLTFDKINQRIFLTNESGILSIFLTYRFPPIHTQSIKTNNSNCIRGIDIDFIGQYIFTGTNKGDISIIELGRPGKERLIKEISYFGGNLEIRTIRYIPENKEIFSGDQSGKITVWSTFTGESIYAWKAHDDAITQMIYVPTKKRLITTAKDKKIKIWEIPDSWTNKDIKKSEKQNIREINDTMAMIRLQNSRNKNINEEDSSEDSLDGWDFKP